MPRTPDHSSPSAPSPAVVRWLTLAAFAGLLFAAASTWVHYRIVNDPFYSSPVCDFTATFSCTSAYTSRFGSMGGVPVALLGVLYFAFVLVLIALCGRSATARRNLPGYVFAVSTLGLAAVLYLGFASFFVLKTVCLLCVGTYVAVIAMFSISGAVEKTPISSLPTRASRDVGTLLRTPAALVSALGFVVLAGIAVMLFPNNAVVASVAESPAPGAEQANAAAPQVSPDVVRQLEQYLATQPRVPILAGGGSGASVVVVKFNDYQCPPCRLTFLEYKPVIARLQQQHPGKIAFVTKDYPLDPECNTAQVGHLAACEAAVAVRLAREKGRAEALEDWLFANQPTLTPERVKEGLASVAGVTDFDARYAKTLELVRADIVQGQQLGVRGTPTFFMNGIRLQTWPAPLFQAAVEWELRRVESK
jgi:uncharacterized membrane protein/protein-disulfide isomerase